MKRTLMFLILHLLFLILINGFINVYAMHSIYSTTDMSVEEQREMIDRLNISTLSMEPKQGYIASFDVSDNGYIAIGTQITPLSYVLVLDHLGNFQYGYQLTFRERFDIQWETETELLLYLYEIQGNTVITIDSEGAVTEIKKIDQSSENKRVFQQFSNRIEKTVNGNTYTLKPNKGLSGFICRINSSYRVLTLRDDGGKTKVVYSRGVDEEKVIQFLFLIFLVVVLGVIVLFWDREIKNKRLTAQELQKRGYPIGSFSMKQYEKYWKERGRH